MPDPLRILCVHGLGDHRQSSWETDWEVAIRQVAEENPSFELDFHFLSYDLIFERTGISFAETLGAFWKLARSGVGGLFRQTRGPVSQMSDRLRWTAGYVVAWVEDEEFQKATRTLVLKTLSDYRPDVVLAHSLGSLITYNAFSHPDARASDIAAALGNVHYLTLGSQIGNPFVLGNLTYGRVQRLPVKHWHHLFNEHDDVFTAPLRVQGVDNFNQLLTPFDLPGAGDHDAVGYLTHAVTRSSFWAPLITIAAHAARVLGVQGTGGVDLWDRSVPAAAASARRKALLIGIDEYPDPANRLSGCVNDVFSMSATLQSCGFEPEQIRLCLNNRATAEGIISRFEWLVDDARASDQLVFYYSGHGARVPEYGKREEPDRLTETLVPYDFDWTPAHSVSDEQIFDLYAQLPYETQFLMIFDCCHSGSMHRDGAARARGITPPDDIRHRQLRWDRGEEMWVERNFDALNRDFAPRAAQRRAFFGDNLATVRLGRAAPLRVRSHKSYDKAKHDRDTPVGPFLPMIIEACGEGQYSYEYRHGATSYGAFTFCLTSLLRREKNITFRDLVDLATERLERLGYDQRPQILGPDAYLNARVPFDTGTGGNAPAGNLPGSATPRTSG